MATRYISRNPLVVPARWRNKPNMKVRVRDFGPIANGEIDLRPLTVFAGPSNTGKSWLATLIYVLNQLADSYPLAQSPFYFGTMDSESEWLGKSGLSQFPEDPKAWVQAIQENKEIYLTTKETNLMSRIMEYEKDGLNAELCRCYGINRPSGLVRYGSENKAEISAHLGEFHHQVTIDKKSKKISLEVKLSDNVPLISSGLRQDTIGRFFSADWSTKNTVNEKRTFRNYPISTYRLLEAILHALHNARNCRHIYYLPADRGGIMHAHAVVVGALIQGASRAGLRKERRLPVLSGVVSNFLEELLEMVERPRRKEGPFAEIIKELEDNILRGKVEVVKSETGYPSFSYRPKGWRNKKLSLVNVSSMISELSPVALYLKHFVAPGDILILEEPEAHLHPAMQQQFAQEIAIWVKAGVRVVLTTHSEWILEELSNIAARGRNGTDDAKGNGLPSLPVEDIGVWLFNHRDRNKPEKGSTIKEIPWKLEEGGFEAEFHDVLVRQNNEWADALNGSVNPKKG